ncbi:helix-turn-helix transcriptional regulator [Xanthomonas theicola]|uniref:AraC family transcriptional regulator n=1 Tax=Xanthomonas theicola TaxID=56464 RepID=A0A2S6ZEL5_9XANT|nr:helix-turn-helix domain-containing protein [Xanthomonas theicola]PPT90717.1 AraC family transcriptional regulator [Xanthomonas theicola]QNH26461.1 helix-turn-helix domain-containing protein [Xanthomonas theicola]
MADTTAAEFLLLAQLATLVDCERAEGYACITARREHGARSVDIPRPQLAILLQGRKQVRTATQALEFAPGDLFLVTRCCRIDVLNVPDPHSGLYLSALIPLCEEVLTAARMLWNEALPASGEELAQLRAIEFGAALLQWRQALEHGHYTEARLALAALVVAFCRRGHGGLLLPPAPSVAAQVRALIAAQPQRAWRARDVEDSLGLSGVTLRRYLAGERASLRALITDARLAHAMELLYTTRWPLKTVAARAGYRSTRSFSQRFRQRYGLDPASIGNA